MKDVLFLGLGNSPVAWYRCALPANALGADWLGIAGHPNDPYILSGNIENADPDDYKTIVIQQLNGPAWLEQIKSWQEDGKTVLYEIDDFIHGIWRIEEHSHRQGFHKKKVKNDYVPCFRQADGMIVSTDFLAEQYKKYNPNIHVAKVGIDVERYDVEKPDRGDHITIGWAGGTGHHKAIGPWLEEVSKILELYENVSFISVGTRYGDIMADRHPGKAISVPWSTLENYPYVLQGMDIAIAPAHESKYALSKSDLRWLEAGAGGIPCVADPRVYLDAEDETTALLADNASDAGDAMMELIEDKELRTEIAVNAVDYIFKNRDIGKAKEQWQKILTSG